MAVWFVVTNTQLRHPFHAFNQNLLEVVYVTTSYIKCIEMWKTGNRFQLFARRPCTNLLLPLKINDQRKVQITHMAKFFWAWWPGGRTRAKPFLRRPSATSIARSTVHPTAIRAAAVNVTLLASPEIVYQTMQPSRTKRCAATDIGQDMVHTPTSRPLLIISLKAASTKYSGQYS